jgi:cyclase
VSTSDSRRGPAASGQIFDREIAERPPEFRGPNLSPVGLELRPHEIAEGTFALVANQPVKDHNGVVFGSKATLVIDSGVVPDVGRQIKRLAEGLSDRPIRFLANTTYHGDHTFGNTAFPDDVAVITSRANRDNMDDLEWEKGIRSANLYDDHAVLDGVTTWRLPDIVFDGYAEIDLGGRIVELHHFGAGNGPGDTIVHVPSARTAWTGNYLCHAGVSHMLLQAGPEPYLASLRKMREALPDLETIVAGHGPMGSAPQAISALHDYLERLSTEVATALEVGRTVEETARTCTDPWAEGLDDELLAAIASYPVPTTAAQASFLDLCRNLHRLNVLTAYRAFQKSAHEKSKG